MNFLVWNLFYDTDSEKKRYICYNCKRLFAKVNDFLTLNMNFEFKYPSCSVMQERGGGNNLQVIKSLNEILIILCACFS